MTRWLLTVCAVAALGLAGCGQGDQAAEEDTAADEVMEDTASDTAEMADDATDEMADETSDAMDDAEDAMAEDAEAMADDMAANEAGADVMEMTWEEAQSLFLDNYATLPGTITTESGLMYQVQREGDGASPGPQDIVEVHYEGRLVNGEIFDSSYERGESIEFPLDRVIPGWTEGLQYMAVGGQNQLVLPPDIAYGDRSPGPGIPPNAVLIFQVELLGVTPVEGDTE